MAASEPIPAAVTRLLSARYPTLQLDPTWLSQCVEYLRSLPGPSRPVTDDQLAKQVRLQLLAADLTAAAATGALAANLSNLKDGTTGAGPKSAVLVQIVSVMDIGISAATQLEVAEARKAALSTLGGAALLHPATSTANATAAARDLGHGQVAATADEDAAHMAEFNAQEDEAEIQATVFPRKMLRLELSDGHGPTVMAFEHERVPGLDMNETRLGCKILLKNAEVRRGQILLTPRCLTIEGGDIEEWQAEAENRLINMLRQKLGKAPLEPTQATRVPANAEVTAATIADRTSVLAASRPAATTRPPPRAATSSRPDPTREDRRPGRAEKKQENIDEFDDYDDSFLLAAAEMDTELEETPAAPIEAQASDRRQVGQRNDNSTAAASAAATSRPPKRKKGDTSRMQAIVLLSDSEDEKPAQLTAAARQMRPVIKSSREEAIVIESSPEP